MKATITILISMIILLMAGIGIVAYQKMVFNQSLSDLQSQLVTYRFDIEDKNAKILALEAEVAALKKPALPQTVLAGKTVIFLSGQTAGSGAINITLAALAQSGYVIIHKEENGQPGTIIGASALLTAGSHENVEIAPNFPLVAGEAYYAMIHFDDSDGFYLVDNDLPARDSQGNPIAMRFIAAPAQQLP